MAALRKNLRRIAFVLRAVGQKVIHGNALVLNPMKVFLEGGVHFVIAQGGSIQIQDGVSIRRGVTLNANGGIISLGAQTFINRNVSINAKKGVTIGHGCLIGENVLMYDHDHAKDVSDRRESFVLEPVILESNVWVGAGGILLRGTRVGADAIVGAGAIIKGEIPSGVTAIQRRKTEFI